MDVRAHLIDALQAELVGPYDPVGGQELLKLAPSRHYLTGFLAPPMTEAQTPVQVDPFADEAVDGEDDYAAGSDRDSDDSAV
ncbi:MAG: hypothetical protein KC457_33335, partial [Myxococcales bacterium]|nr:hypothetical protein [Myxococcales bacterium]